MLLMYLEQMFRISFRKQKKTYARLEYFVYEILDLDKIEGERGRGLQLRLSSRELMDVYIRELDCHFQPFLSLCKKAIGKIENDDTYLTISPREISKMNLIRSMQMAVELKGNKLT